MRATGGPRTRPTASAVSVVAFVIGALPAALAGLDLAWLLVAAAFAVLIVAPFLARRQVGAIESVLGPRRITVAEGRTSIVPVTYTCRRAVHDVLVSMTRADAGFDEHGKAPRIAWTTAERTGRLDVPIRIPRRGRYNRIRWQATTTFPFGLFTSRRHFEGEVALTVHPRVFERSDRRLDPILRSVASGSDEPRRPNHRVRGRGLPMTLRAARKGDTIRDIAWRHSVRKGQWLAHERAPSAHASIVVTLVRATFGRGPYGVGPYDAESSPHRNTDRSAMAFEWSVRTAASLAVRLIESGHRVTTRVSDWEPATPTPPKPNVRGASIECTGRRPHDHLEFLTDIRLDDPAPPPAAREGKRTTAFEVRLFPIVRTIGDLDDTDSPRRARAATGRSLDFGVDAVGRMTLMRWRSPARTTGRTARGEAR